MYNGMLVNVLDSYAKSKFLAIWDSKILYRGCANKFKLPTHYVTKRPKNWKSEPGVETYLDGKRVPRGIQ